MIKMSFLRDGLQILFEITEKCFLRDILRRLSAAQAEITVAVYFIVLFLYVNGHA